MNWAERVNRWDRNRMADDQSHTGTVAFASSTVMIGGIAAAVLMAEGMGV